MRKFCTALLVSLFAVVGCQRESEPGGPGATPTVTEPQVTPAPDTTAPDTTAPDMTPGAALESAPPAQEPTIDPQAGQPQTGAGQQDQAITDRDDDRVTAEERTFTLSVPSLATNVARGQRQEVTISIDRGEAFNQLVRLEFQTPAGVQVTPANPEIKPGESETKVFIEATETAAAGEASIEVRAIPETGQPVSLSMPVEVEEQE